MSLFVNKNNDQFNSLLIIFYLLSDTYYLSYIHIQQLYHACKFI